MNLDKMALDQLSRRRVLQGTAALTLATTLPLGGNVILELVRCLDLLRKWML
jgi:hypothetical protein